MFVITDLGKINTVYEQKAPRPIKDLLLEIYPECTVDCNGRAHAPYDGYECTLTGKTFRAGEYLPFNDPDENYRIMGKTYTWPKGTDLHGVLHEWPNGTRAQKIAVYAELIAQSKAHSATISKHIGVVGTKETFELTINYLGTYFGMYGTVYLHIMQTEDGSVAIYKGSKKLGNKEQKISVVGKIKEHGERDGIKQTVIERPKLLTQGI